MKHKWFQKKQTEFLYYKQPKVTNGGNLMTRGEQIARFYAIYDKMSVSDRECMTVGMAYVLGGKIGTIFIFGILLGIIVGHIVW